MSINLSDNIQIGQQLPVDSRYLNGYSTWADVTTAVGGIPSALRFIGLTVNVAGVEYWWKDGITDPNLIIKSPDLPPTVLSALPFSTDHLLATNNQYVVDDVVYYLGDVYKCIADNDSIIPTNILYWAKIGPGFPIVQQPADWTSTTGNNQILNKPTIPTLTSQLTNDVPFLTQDNVVEYPNLASFPVTGVIGTIYIALDTGFFYSWNGTAYVLSSPTNTGITGIGITNYLPKFTSPTAIGNSLVYDDGTNIGIGTITPSTKLSVEFNDSSSSPKGGLFKNTNSLGRASVFTYNDINEGGVFGTYGNAFPTASYRNNFAVSATKKLLFVSDGDISNGGTSSIDFIAGGFTNTPTLKITNGVLNITQTPTAGATSDKLLVRDTSGNVKQIDYPAIQSVGFEQNFLLMGS